MIPAAEDTTIFLGDADILQDDSIVCVVGAIEFRKYPRILLSRLFSAPGCDEAVQPVPAVTPAQSRPVSVKKQLAAPVATALAAALLESQLGRDTPRATETVAGKTKAHVNSNSAAAVAERIEIHVDSDSTAVEAMMPVTAEPSLELLNDLDDDDVMFSKLGVNSLMSLVITEKFRKQLLLSFFLFLRCLLYYTFFAMAVNLDKDRTQQMNDHLATNQIDSLIKLQIPKRTFDYRSL
ncbi:hypothetical protein F5B21DRAFT_510141 [Xylaria acuta]|nr:hypothetical protein F5B21DRAFT_510141 [Xylaria acuta]